VLIGTDGSFVCVPSTYDFVNRNAGYSAEYGGENGGRWVCQHSLILDPGRIGGGRATPFESDR